MTTATDTEVVEAPADEDDEVCACIWWTRLGPRQCPNAAEYEVIGHSYGGGVEPCVDGTAAKICQRCLDVALDRMCRIHEVSAIYSYSRIK